MKCVFVFYIKNKYNHDLSVIIYSTGAAAVSSVVYGAGSGHIFLDELNCKGTETNLEICSNSMFYLNSCKHSNDVGIVCDIGKKRYLTACFIANT